MCNIIKRISSFKLRVILLFAFTFFLGLWSAGYFERYIIKFSIQERFTKVEANKLLNHKVKELCYSNAQKTSEIYGKTVSYNTDEYGDVWIDVFYPEFGKQQNQTIGYDKGSFSQCLVDLGEAER